MGSLNWLDIVVRWLHIFSAIALVGATIFMRFALHPSLANLDETARKSLQQTIRRRWMPIASVGILLLLVSGLYNIFVNSTRYDLPGYYNGLFGVKFLLAFGIFFLVSVLSGRSPGTERFRENPVKWLNLSLALAFILICISGILRNTPKPDKPATSEQSADEAAYDPSIPSHIRTDG